MTEDLRQDLTMLYMLRGMDELIINQQQAIILLEHYGSKQELPPPPQQIQHTSGTMPDDTEKTMQPYRTNDTENSAEGASDTELLPPIADSAPSLVFETDKGIQAVKAEEILHIRAEEKHAILRFSATGEDIRLIHTMKQIEERITAIAHLVRCHHSLIVNLRFCPCYTPKGKDGIVYISHNGTQHPHNISRTYKAEFLRKWHLFYGNP